MALAGILFAFLGSRVMELGYLLRASSYHQLLYYVCGRRLGMLLDWATALFLFGGLCIMLSGTGTVCRDYLDINYHTGTVLMALVVAIAVLWGVKGIATINLLIIPLLLGATITVCASSMLYHWPELVATIITLPSQPHLSPTSHWLPACLLYVSYNVILGATLLAPLGKETPDRTARLLGAILGGLLLTALGLMIMIAIMLHYPQIIEYEVPMLYVSNTQHGFQHASYALMLLKAMFSTAMASLYGCTMKLQSVSRLSFPVCLAAVVAASLIGSQFGFANLVATLYPLFGYIALLFTSALVWQFCRDRLSR